MQTEIAKRLNAIIVQVLPFLAQEHQQQVASAIERAKQVTMTELNAIIGVSCATKFSITTLHFIFKDATPVLFKYLFYLIIVDRLL